MRGREWSARGRRVAAFGGAVAAALTTMSMIGTARDAAAERAPLCGEGAACAVSVTHDGETQERTYRVRPPSDWDGETRLPVVIHFHGWGRSARFVVNNRRQTEPAERQGVLLVAPDSIGPTWTFRTPESRDVALLDALIADLEARAPIDRARVLISGFSHGGSMVWRAACDRGSDYAGFTPIAGFVHGFDTADCADGVARVLQVHGRNDPVLPAPLGETTDPGDDFLIWRRPANCAPEPVETRQVGRFECRHWRSCDAGGSAGLCLLNAHHANPRGWLDYAIPTLLEEADAAAIALSEEPRSVSAPAATQLETEK